MSRSGYNDDIGVLELGRWRAQVASAIRGKRGQLLLRDMLQALDAMTVKELIREELEMDGRVCALGALGKARGVDMTNLDPTEPVDVAEAFDIAHQLAQEVVYENDEGGWRETPAERWARMRKWVLHHIKPARSALSTPQIPATDRATTGGDSI